MTDVLSFTNPGEIDDQLITTLGVNVKEGSSPIGYFGTGLKFAIATILRHGGQITIYSGLRKLEFLPEAREIRGKMFQLVIMRERGVDRPLAFTLDLGKNWWPWMAIRELWSNAKDEGGSTLMARLEPEAGATLIEVTGKELVDAWNNRREWLIESPPLATTSCVSIHSGETPLGFYRGLRVAQWNQRALFTYNVLEETVLTEDRTTDRVHLYGPLCRGLSRELEDRELLKKILLAPRDTMEGNLDWAWAYGQPSATFISVIEELYDHNLATLNRSALEMCRSHMTKRIPKAAEMTRIERIQLDRALAFLAKNGHPVAEPITVVDTLGSQWIAGLAAEGRIYLPKATFGKGTKFVASTLLEEHLHLSKSLPDESRAMQDWLFDKVLSLMEELAGEPL